MKKVLSKFFFGGKRMDQDPESIDPEAIQADTQAAIELLQTAQTELEDVSHYNSPFYYYLTE